MAGEKNTTQGNTQGKTVKAVDDYGARIFATAMKIVDNGVKMVDEAVERDKARRLADEAELARRNAEEAAMNARLIAEAEARRQADAERERNRIEAELAELRAQIAQGGGQPPNGQDPQRPARNIPWGWTIVIILLALILGWVIYSIAHNPGSSVSAPPPPPVTSPIDQCFQGGPVLCRENVQPCCEALPHPWSDQCLAKMQALLVPANAFLR